LAIGAGLAGLVVFQPALAGFCVVPDDDGLYVVCGAELGQPVKKRLPHKSKHHWAPTFFDMT